MFKKRKALLKTIEVIDQRLTEEIEKNNNYRKVICSINDNLVASHKSEEEKLVEIRLLVEKVDLYEAE